MYPSVADMLSFPFSALALAMVPLFCNQIPLWPFALINSTLSWRRWISPCTPACTRLRNPWPFSMALLAYQNLTHVYSLSLHLYFAAVFIVGNLLIPNWNCESAIYLCICCVEKLFGTKTGVLSAIRFQFLSMVECLFTLSLILSDTLVLATDRKALDLY